MSEKRETVFLRKNPLLKILDALMVDKSKLQVKLLVKMGGRGNKLINDGLIRTKEGDWKSIKLGYLINNEIPEECIAEDERGRPLILLRFDNGSGNIEFMKPEDKDEIIKAKEKELTNEELNELKKQNSWYLTPGQATLKPLDIRADDILERVDRKVYTEFFKKSPWKWLIGLAIAFMIGLGISFAFMANGIMTLEQVKQSIINGAQSAIPPGA